MRAPRAPKSDADVRSEAPAEQSVSRASIGIKRTPELEAAIGARIRAARIAAKMSQVDLGSAVGISYQQVHKYERGVDRIAASTLQRVATILGVQPGSFFDDVSVPTGSVVDVRAAARITERIQRVRDPGVVKRLLALVDLLAVMDGATAEHSTATGDEAP